MSSSVWGPRPTWGSAPAARLSAVLQRPFLPPLPPARGQRRSARGVAERARATKQGAGSSRGVSRGALQLRWVHLESLLLLCTEGVCYQRDVTDRLRPPFNIRVGTSDLTRPCTKGLKVGATTILNEQTLTRLAGTSQPDTLLHRKI